jgi:hypothetical protein
LPSRTQGEAAAIGLQRSGLVPVSLFWIFDLFNRIAKAMKTIDYIYRFDPKNPSAKPDSTRSPLFL